MEDLVLMGTPVEYTNEDTNYSCCYKTPVTLQYQSKRVYDVMVLMKIQLQLGS
ncbi:Hypothetical protein CINCED_3A020024 [Cinara cedri]|uniref:Uncharacterized protein n=1 Tax=Cinara cedri TaxID=506608 RepID=A0A5E4M3Z4_9HEMI|nr:Hypothetical protein CINCED_3A020024 [Cinara cedri]